MARLHSFRAAAVPARNAVGRSLCTSCRVVGCDSTGLFVIRVSPRWGGGGCNFESDCQLGSGTMDGLPAAWRRDEESFAAGLERLKTYAVMKKVSVEGRLERMWSQVGALLDAAREASKEQATASWQTLGPDVALTDDQRLERDARVVLREVMMAFLGDRDAGIRA